MRIVLALAAALVAGTGPAARAESPLGPHALTNLSDALMRAYNDDDAAAMHGLLAPPLRARYTPEAVRTALTRCRVLTGDIFRLSTPSWGARNYGFFAVYAETAVFEMILEIGPDGRILHWVITDDVTADEQQCRLSRS